MAFRPLPSIIDQKYLEKGSLAQALIAGLTSITAPVTSITLAALAGNLATYSTATLYGVRNAAKTAGNSIKATGGNISFDGTYVYHVFPSTGTFTPTKILTADYLVVAGGGAIAGISPTAAAFIGAGVAATGAGGVGVAAGGTVFSCTGLAATGISSLSSKYDQNFSPAH